jgi:hypothetical protein
MMGRYIGCWAERFVGRGFGSLIAYIEASKMCGSTVIVHVPSFVIDSLGGLLGGCSVLPFLFTGFVQYFSNMPSLSHFCRDLCNESGRTPLCHQSVYLPKVGHADSPFRDRLKLFCRQIYWLGLIDSRECFARCNALG